MLKDLLNTEMGSLSFMGDVAVCSVKQYGPRFPGGNSFEVRNAAVLLMKSGTFKIQSGETVQDLKAHDLFVFPKKSYCHEIGAGGELQFYLIRFSANGNRGRNDCLHNNSLLVAARKEALKISLDKNDYLVLSLMCRLVYAEENNMEATDFEADLRRISFNLLLFELKLIHAKYFISSALHMPRAEKLAIRFLTVLSIHCRKHHAVKFYAGVLYVTSGYLNRVVKQATGKTAKRMIAEAVLAQAVNLLEDSDFSIAEIAEELEFSSASAFDIFFKKLMFCTPSEYRSKCL